MIIHVIKSINVIDSRLFWDLYHLAMFENEEDAGLHQIISEKLASIIENVIDYPKKVLKFNSILLLSNIFLHLFRQQTY